MTVEMIHEIERKAFYMKFSESFVLNYRHSIHYKDSYEEKQQKSSTPLTNNPKNLSK
jgi:hypothetical protein